MRNVLLIPLLVPGIAFSQGTTRAATPSATPLTTMGRAQTPLDDSLNDKNPDTRKHAVQSLGLVSPTEPYLSRLEAMLADKDVEVRLAAIASLVDLENPRTVATLRMALDSNVPEVSFAAAKALWTLDEPAGREALLSVLSGEDKKPIQFHHPAEAPCPADVAYADDVVPVHAEGGCGLRSRPRLGSGGFLATGHSRGSGCFRPCGDGASAKPRQRPGGFAGA